MLPDTADRRAFFCDRIAEIVLAEGLSAFALRGLASRLGTSGRMLLYYFGSKDRMVREVLRRISERLAAFLASRTDAPLATPGQLMVTLLTLAGQVDIAPFMRVWTEVIAAGARGESPFDDVAPAVVADWITAIDSRLLPKHRGNGTAEAILALMDGLTLLELARPGTTGPARALLPGLLDGHGGDSHGAPIRNTLKPKVTDG